jgi:hypothetical protein
MTPTALLSYLDLLFGAEPPSSYAELRWKLRDGAGMGREFVRLTDQGRLADLIRAKGRDTDIYIGVAPRDCQQGGRDAVSRLHALWVDLDDAGGLDRLAAFAHEPSMLIRSGAGHHAYWALWPPIGPADAERANRRLAHALGGDMRATDAARILRPPSTVNLKTGKAVPVEMVAMHVEHYDARELVRELPDPPGKARGARLATPIASDDPLRAIPPAVYVEALAGEAPDRDGKVRCPFHDDGTPSLHVYDGGGGWFCYGCEAGGSIIDFGAALYGLEPRGKDYQEIRRRLAADLLGGAHEGRRAQDKAGAA